MKLPPYPKYKASGVPWIGEIPVHWTATQVRRAISSVVNGVWGDDPDGVDDIICVRVADFDRDRLRVTNGASTLRAVDTRSRSARALAPGDLLIEKSGGGDAQPVGCVISFDADFEAVCSNFIGRLRVPSGHHSRFWTYVHASLYGGRLTYPSVKQTTGIQNLDTDAYFSTPVAYPPFGEQVAIANFLDSRLREIVHAIELKRKLTERLRERRAAVISRAVTRAPSSSSGNESRSHSVGLNEHVPDGWKLLPFTKYVVDRTDYRGRTPEKVESGIFLVTARNVRMGFIDYAVSQEYVDEEAYDEIMRRGVPQIGDIVFTTEAPLGNVALVDREKVALAQRIIRFRMDSRFFLNSFVLFAMMSQYFQAQLESLSTGSTAEGLKASRLTQLRLLAPPLDQQSAIVDFLTKTVGETDRLISQVETAIDRLQEYRTALITAAVTGKIDVRNAITN